MAAPTKIVLLGKPLGRVALHKGLLSSAFTGRLSVLLNHQPVRDGSQKHYDPLFRKHRAVKVVKLPKLHQQLNNFENLSDDEKRIVKKKIGVPPEVFYEERSINLGYSGQAFDPYSPDESDVKSYSVLARNPKKSVTQKYKSYRATREIKKYEPDFKAKRFINEAQEMYIETHKLLQDYKKNINRLREIVTDHGLSLMTQGLHMKTLRWDIKETLEMPRVVQIRCESALVKDNYFGQVTVRFHTKQSLAMYDRFGKLMFGDEDLYKNIVEYVVFEKHVSDTYGTWRVHEKIFPDSQPERDPVRTYKTEKKAPSEETALVS